MELKGRYILRASRDNVWAALSDLSILESCLPGCESLERLSDGEVKAVVAVEIGPFKSRFTGRIGLHNPVLPHRWTLRGAGRGRPAGSARGSADVELSELGNETAISFVGSAEVGGKLAEIAAAEIEAQAKEMTDRFFSRLEEEIQATEPKWVDQLDHTLAGVPQLGDEPSERVVEDKAEIAGETANVIERRVEIAAGRDFLGGPYVWGLLALVVLIVILTLMY